MTSNRQTQPRQRSKRQTAGPRGIQHSGPSCVDFREHRMPSEHLVIAGEDPASVEALVADFDKRYRPADVVEDCLVQEMMRDEWRCRRMNRVEACLLQDRTQDHTAKLAPLTKYKLALRQNFRRCLRQLADLRTTEVRSPHLIDGGIPTATVTTRRASEGPQRVRLV